MASLYALNADFEAYVEGWVTDSAPALTRLLERAERDVDSIVGPWGVSTLTSSLTLPTGTLYLDSTNGILPSTGSVLIGSQTVTFTGKTQTTLTGGTGGTGDFAAGTTVRRVPAASGLKFDPLSMLSTSQALALKRATCAQAEYRFENGELFMVRDQYRETSGPDFSQVGSLDYIAPKAWRELQGQGLLIETCVG